MSKEKNEDENEIIVRKLCVLEDRLFNITKMIE
jgi:hypothetical protein